MWRLFFTLSMILLVATGDTYGDALPLFDAHIHYNHDAWEVVSPKEAIERLRKARVVRALVSSSSDDGTQKLYAQAPDLIVPELRPYRKNGETTSWLRDESIIEHVEQRLKQHKYVALGEFHVSGATRTCRWCAASYSLRSSMGSCSTCIRIPMRWSACSVRTRRRGSSGHMPATRSRRP